MTRREKIKCITIGSARLARGYSGCDHLLDDSPLAAMVGRTYKTEAAAARAAGKLLRGTQDRRCDGGPVILLDEHGAGSTWWTTGGRVS